MNAFMVALALLAEPLVSFHADAVRTGALVESLADQSGRKLTFSPAVADEPVVADFSNVPLNDVLSRIALVVGAEWIAENDELRLTRTSALIARQQREERERIVSAWKEVLDAGEKEVNELTKFDEDQARKFADLLKRLEEDDSMMSTLQLENPTNRAAALLLARIGAQAISSLAIGERVVYSDHPTPMQRSFPPGSIAILNDLRQSAKWLKDAAAIRSIYSGLIRLGTGNFSQYGKTVLAVARTGLLRLSYSILVVDRQGEGIAFGSGTIPGFYRTLYAPRSERGPRLELTNEILLSAKIASQAGVAMASGMPLQLPNGKVIQVSSWRTLSERDDVPLDRGMGRILSDPVTYDPIGLYFGKLLRQVAKNDRVAVLGTVGDDSLFDFARELITFGSFTQSAFLEFLEQKNVPNAARAPYAEIKRDDGWLIVQPYLPVYARSTRFDRLAARELIQALQSKQYASADDGVRYVSKSAHAIGIRSIDKILISHATPSVDQTSIDGILRTPAEFFAAAGPEIWRTILNRSIPYSRLSTNLRNILHQWVYWSTQLATDVSMNFDVAGESPLAKEPTEAFSNGIPGDSIVEIEVIELPAVIAKSTTGHYFNMSVYSWAYDSENPTRAYEGFRPATQFCYLITLSLPGGRKATRTMIETVPRIGSTFVSREQLPQELLRAYEQANAILRGGSHSGPS
jgi:hypothetical protein